MTINFQMARYSPMNETYVKSIGNGELSGICSRLKSCFIEDSNSNERNGSSAAIRTSAHKRNHQIGKHGELLVFNWLLEKFSDAEVSWLNGSDETNANYDIVIHSSYPIDASSYASMGESSRDKEDHNSMKRDLSTHNQNNQSNSRNRFTTYIEVKTTSSADRNVFPLSLWQWRFASDSIGSSTVSYHVVRLFAALSADLIHAKVITDLVKALEVGTIQLCLAC
jgi:hypothetical protein